MQKLLKQMEAALVKGDDNQRLTHMVQHMIYFFNQPSIRDYVVDTHAKRILTQHGRRVEWDGTYFFDENGIVDHMNQEGIGNGMPLAEYLRTRKAYTDNGRTGPQFVISTCCVTYEGNRVHFLTLIYDRRKKALLFFDPGIHMYEKGQDVAVPIVNSAFRKNGWVHNIKNTERVGLCTKDYYGKKWGIQYNGKDPSKTVLPADSFCQSWTLYYIIEFLRHKCSDTFFPKWCTIPPDKRETFLLMNFFLPHIQNHPFLYKEWERFYPDADMALLNQHVIDNFSK